MRELPLAAARADGWLPAHAAMHLLTFTDLPGSAQFAAHVEVRDAWSPGGPVRGAWVRDWDALLAAPDHYLTGTGRRFLGIAASFAAGRAISLSEQVTSELGWAHAQRGPGSDHHRHKRDGAPAGCRHGKTREAEDLPRVSIERTASTLTTVI